MITKSWDKTWITKAFTLDFQVEAMEANALTLLFTYIPNDVKDNEANPTNSIRIVIDNCLQPSFTPLGMATIGDASTSNNVKVFELK